MKFIKKTVTIVILTILIVFGMYMGTCYVYYRSIVSKSPMDEVVAQVESKATFVNFDELPDSLVKATISIEDRRFYYHNGVDIIGTGRALISQFSSKYARSGGSTITQQTVKNLYNMFNINPLYKGCQMFMAWDLEKMCSKDEIFAIYVNIINYGDNHTGIYEASTGYFGVNPSDLTLAQSSLLAGIPQSPSFYQLSSGYDNAKTRQWSVLHAMAKEGYIDETQIDSIWNESVW